MRILRCMCLVALGLLGCAAAAAPQAVTATFQDGVRGYRGTRDTALARNVPDHNLGARDDMQVGRYPQNGEEFKGLVKFTGLSIPRGSRIVSAKLSLFCAGVNGAPRIAAYGLLKDFAEGAQQWAKAQPGEATWNSVQQGREPWKAPGAANESDRFEYDANADCHQPADDTVTVNDLGWFTWNVAASFADQFARGKEYGWVLEEVTRSPGANAAVFVPREGSLPDMPLRPYPKLTVTHVPAEPGGAVRAWPGPQLILFDMVEPTTLRRDLKRAAALPFDGGVFRAEPNRHPPSGEGWLNISVFGPDKLRGDDYSEFIESARAIQRMSPLTHNFLRVTIVPGTLERKGVAYNWETRPRAHEPVRMWFSDFEPVLHNIKVAATVAREAGLRGIVFDWEEYGGNIWAYGRQQDAQEQGKTLEQTILQVRKRAEQFMQAINRVYPDMTIIIIPFIYARHAPELLTAFMDGLIAASDPRMTIVDGNEKYHLSSLQQFRDTYDFNYAQAPSLSTVPEKYSRHVEVGFGVWLNGSGWSRDPELAYSAARWQVKLENALLTADTYVWVFTGGAGALTPDWWTRQNLPRAYVDATRRARDLARQMRRIERRED